MNEQKLKQIFAETFELPVEKVEDDLKYNSIERWDSIGHMSLIAALDDAFDTMLETEDVLDLSSFKKAKEILAKYGVSF
ncbi:Acyl carrier protein [compost metagenome]